MIPVTVSFMDLYKVRSLIKNAGVFCETFPDTRQLQLNTDASSVRFLLSSSRDSPRTSTAGLFLTVYE